MLIMTSIVRVGQSKFAAIPIDEDSQERIMNCVETLARLQASQSVKEIFLHDTKAAYAKMVATEEVGLTTGWFHLRMLTRVLQKKAREKKAKETNAAVVQADDLISFRQFNKKSTGGDVDDVGRPPQRREVFVDIAPAVRGGSLAGNGSGRGQGRLYLQAVPDSAADRVLGSGICGGFRQHSAIRHRAGWVSRETQINRTLTHA